MLEWAAEQATEITTTAIGRDRRSGDVTPALSECNRNCRKNWRSTGDGPRSAFAACSGVGLLKINPSAADVRGDA